MEVLIGLGVAGIIGGFIWLIIALIVKDRKMIPLAVMAGGFALLLISAVTWGIQNTNFNATASTTPNPYATMTYTPDPYATMTYAQLASMAQSPSYDSLFRYNENYVGQLVQYQGQVIQVLEVSTNNYQLRVNVTKGQYSWDDTVFVRYSGNRLLENDIIDFVGKVNGLVTYTAVLGNSVTIPDISAIRVNLVEKEGGN